MDALQEKPRISDVPLPHVRAIILTNSSLVGRSIRDAHLTEQFGVSAIAVTKASGEIVLDPPPDMVLLRGDTLRLLGFSEQIQALLDATATNEWGAVD